MIVTLLAFIAHALVVARAVTFFTHKSDCRESDKTSVAAIAALSGLFMLSQLIVWIEHPGRLIVPSSVGIGGPMFMGYNLAVAIVFLGQIHIVLARRANSCSVG